MKMMCVDVDDGGGREGVEEGDESEKGCKGGVGVGGREKQGGISKTIHACLAARREKKFFRLDHHVK